MTISNDAMALLQKRRARITHHISDEKLAVMHGKGMLSARERVEALFVEGTFQELGMHAHHNAVTFGMAGRELPTTI